jgi:hypothetical protein
MYTLKNSENTVNKTFDYTESKHSITDYKEGLSSGVISFVTAGLGPSDSGGARKLFFLH